MEREFDSKKNPIVCKSWRVSWLSEWKWKSGFPRNAGRISNDRVGDNVTAMGRNFNIATVKRPRECTLNLPWHAENTAIISIYPRRNSKTLVLQLWPEFVQLTWCVRNIINNSSINNSDANKRRKIIRLNSLELRSNEF